MKKSSMLMLPAILLVFAACGQKLDASKVPTAVKTSFEKAYPGVNAKWEKEDGNYEVSFKKDSKEVSIVVSADGIILETETAIALTELPAAAASYLKTHYAGKTIKETARITAKDGSLTYEAGLKEMDILFDSHGNFIKEVKD